jgi:hypothetical protein
LPFTWDLAKNMPVDAEQAKIPAKLALQPIAVSSP